MKSEVSSRSRIRDNGSRDESQYETDVSLCARCMIIEVVAALLRNTIRMAFVVRMRIRHLTCQ